MSVSMNSPRPVPPQALVDAFDLLPVAWCAFDRNLRLTNMNRKLAALTGLCGDSAMGRTAADLFPALFGEIGEDLVPTLDGKALEGVVVEGASLGHPAEGRSFVLSLQPVATEDGRQGGFVALFQEVTEQKRAEAAVEEGGGSYRYAFELSPHICWTMEPDGRILNVSPRASAISGLAVEDFLRDGWLGAVHREDRHEVRQARAASLESGLAADYEYRLRMADGTYRWARSRAAPKRDADGRILRWYGTTEDIHDRKTAEAALRESEAFARSILESSPDSMGVIDFGGHLLFMNGTGLRAMEIGDFASVAGRTWEEQWPAAGAAAAREAVGEAKAGRTARFSALRPAAAGSPKWWDVCVSPIPGPDGSPARLLALSRDITEAKRAQDEIERARAEARKAASRFRAMLESTTDAVILLDLDGRATYVNQRAAAMFAAGCLKAGALLSDCFPAEDWGSFELHFGLAMAERMPVGFEEHLDSMGLWLDVHAYPTADGALTVVIRDKTVQRAAEREQMVAQEQITHMARHDALTGLPNRADFRERLGRALADMRHDGHLAVLYLDLDGFKAVNDTFGHPMGDALLRQVADRLQRCLRYGDTVARFGGDEFAVLQMPSRQAGDSGGFARRLVDVISEPYDLDGHHVAISTSIGIAVAPGDGAQVDDIIRRADLALYAAKAAGRGTHRFFERHMDEELRQKQTLKDDLRRALKHGEIGLQYQPIVDLRTNRIACFEALLRWQHPERGLVHPCEFISVAEESALILPIGRLALREACREAAGWPGGTGVAVNLSPVQFRGNGLVGTVRDALATSGLSPDRLELEITESVLLHDSEANLAQLRALKQIGIRIAMDDFGTGYSSLSYLRRFPFDKLKIDRSFVSDLPGNSESRAIVRAVVGLGASLGVTVTAEGVETREQLKYLCAEKCGQAQGYLFSMPVCGDEAAALAVRAEALAAPLGMTAAAQSPCQ